METENAQRGNPILFIQTLYLGRPNIYRIQMLARWGISHINKTKYRQTEIAVNVSVYIYFLGYEI